MNDIIRDELRKAEINMENAAAAIFCALLLAAPAAVWLIRGG
jgi:hypothetical protein